MTVCHFWQRGVCKNGNRCRFDHFEKAGPPPSSQNRFGVLNSDSLGHGQTRDAYGSNRGARSSRDLPYKLDKETIINDLSKETPLWILSSYGPGRDAPRQLFGGGAREQSFEELRLRHYELAAAGNQQQAIQEAQTLVNNAQQQMQNALQDIDGAVNYIIDGEKEHPNRMDIVKAKGTVNPLPQPPSSSGAVTSFGKPSVLSAPGNTPFGQPSPFAQATHAANPFANAPTFGKPTHLSTQAPSPFGQPLGRPPTAFGQPTTSSSLGQHSTAFTAVAFGHSNTSVFNQPSNPFARPPNSQPSSFGQPSQPAVPARTSFGSILPESSNPLGQQPQASITHPLNQPSQPSSLSPFTLPSSSSPAPSAFSATTPANTKRDANNRLTLWKSHPVTYIDDEPCFRRSDGEWEKIWFPNGPPVWKKPLEEPLRDEVYVGDELQEEPEEVVRDRLAKLQEAEEAYRWMRETGTWKGGLIPEIAPKREWCRWDF